MEEEGNASMQLIRSFEFRLLRCTLGFNGAPPPPPPPSCKVSESYLVTLIEEVVQLIESGNYVQALSSDAAQMIFKMDSSFFFVDSVDSAASFYSELVVNSASSFVNSGGNKGLRVFLVVAIAVAAFLVFVQCNIIGPIEKFQPIPLKVNAESVVNLGEWEVWARNELMSAGSDLLGKISYLQYLVFAKLLLFRIRDILFVQEEVVHVGIFTISWWLARVILVQQKILDGLSSSLFDMLQVLMRESLHHFGSLEKVRDYWQDVEEASLTSIVSMLHLEVGIMEYKYSRVDPSTLHFEYAREACGLSFSVSGAMGVRTIHQVDPRSQRILVVTDSSSTNGGDGVSNSNVGEGKFPPHGHQIHEASDVMLTPRFVEDNAKTLEVSASGIQIEGGISCLKPVQQALILAQCLLIEKNTAQDEMQSWDKAPYIEAIDSQPFSYFIIRFFCDLLRKRWEATRSRTKERAILLMEKLVEGLYESSPGVSERIYSCFGVDIPTIPTLRKEYGDLLVSCGLIGEAVRVYEDLELWDNVIYCYRLLDKRASAVELIKSRLSEKPNEPRLWCSLGDVTDNDDCYVKALEVSENRSVRAKRSLARSAYNRGEYEKSKILWESAMTLNSLYPDGWFALGSAALKARDLEKALDSFTRAVQLDPENGEAWNNIAFLHMTKKKTKEALIAFKEALKFKRDSWQMWENYSQVSVENGNYGLAMEAIQKVLNMTNNKRVDVALLERLMVEFERRTSHSNSHVDSSVSGVGELGLVDLFGKILQQIVRSGGNGEVWGLFARWHKLKGDLTMCSEALLKQVRSYQGSELWKDGKRFKKFAYASLELCNVYMEISSRDSSTRELHAAEMHLKNTIRQAVVNFSETEEFKDLQACLDKLQALKQGFQLPKASVAREEASAWF